MTKILISLDDYAYSWNGQFFLDETGNTLIKRYLKVFDTIRIALRTKFVQSEGDLGSYAIPVDTERVEVFPLPFFQGPLEYAKNYLAVKQKLKKLTEGCSGALIRIPSTVGFANLKQVRRHKLPYAVEVVFNPQEMVANAQSIAHRLLWRIIHKQQVAACKNADGASYVTEHTLQRIYPATKKGHFESAYSSVELPQSFYGSQRVYPKARPFVICHVANVIRGHRKGHRTVLEVVRRLNEKGYDVEARFAGDGESVADFRQLAKQWRVESKIEFVGFLTKDELRDLLQSSDLMVLPTKVEGLPRALIEAMATGMPCLSTPVSGIPELLPGNLLYAKDDAEGFAGKISEIIDNPAQYEELSKTAFQKSREYTLEKLEKRRTAFYEKLKERADQGRS